MDPCTGPTDIHTPPETKHKISYMNPRLKWTQYSYFHRDQVSIWTYFFWCMMSVPAHKHHAQVHGARSKDKMGLSVPIVFFCRVCVPHTNKPQQFGLGKVCLQDCWQHPSQPASCLCVQSNNTTHMKSTKNNLDFLVHNNQFQISILDCFNK
jgi:hypothetical protein